MFINYELSPSFNDTIIWSFWRHYVWYDVAIENEATTSLWHNLQYFSFLNGQHTAIHLSTVNTNTNRGEQYWKHCEVGKVSGLRHHCVIAIPTACYATSEWVNNYISVINAEEIYYREHKLVFFIFKWITRILYFNIEFIFVLQIILDSQPYNTG